MRRIRKNGERTAFYGAVYIVTLLLAIYGLDGCASKESRSEIRPAKTIPTKSQQSKTLTGIYDQLIKRLQPDIKSKKAEVQKFENQVRITIPNDVLFPGGGWVIDKRGHEILDKIVPVVKELKNNPIEVYGYTDNGPISPSMRSKFSTNRELSLARAVDIVNYFQKKGIDRDVLSATGYGEEQPVATNDTPLGRAKNRRMEIAIMANDG